VDVSVDMYHISRFQHNFAALPPSVLEGGAAALLSRLAIGAESDEFSN
jgi:hypothetical protein